MKFYSAYDTPPSVGIVFDPDENMTEQHHAEDCDINNIIAKYTRTGVLGDPFAMPSVSAQFGDFTAISDYQTAMNNLIQAQQAFEALPAALRKEFDNDPAKLLDFLGKEENRDEAIRLGLIPRPVDTSNSTTPSATPVGTTPTA